MVPSGLEYFGTHQIPLIDGSLETSFSTISISGPSLCIGIFIISIPKYSVIAKCRSYPGTGHNHFTLSNLHHGVEPITPCVILLEIQSNITFNDELPKIIILSLGTSIISPNRRRHSVIPNKTP